MGESRSPNSAAASSAPAARFIAGDPIRAIAALGVFLLHAGAAAVIAAQWGRVVNTPRWPQQMFGSVLGELLASVGNGVPIFFALSAYLIVRPFARAFIDETPPPGIIRYLRHRAFRILPAFWVVLTALVVIYGVSGASFGDLYAFRANWQEVFFGASHRFAPAWSMNVEVRFYLGVVVLAIALVILRRPLRRWRWARVGLMLGASLAACIATLIAYRHTTQAVALTLPAQLYAFVPGVVLAAIEPLIPPRIPHARVIRWMGALFALAGIFTLCAYNFLVVKFIRLFGFSPNVGGRVYLASMSSAIIGGPLLYQWAGGGCWRILDNAPLRWLGTRSYAFYLIHFAVLISLAEVLHGIGGYKLELVVIVAAAFALTALLSEVSYRVVEVPCQRMARRIGRSRVPPGAHAAPATDSSPTTAEQTATLIQT